MDIDYVSLSLNAGTESYCISAKIQVASEEEFEKCLLFSPVSVTIDGTSYSLFIESKTKEGDVSGYVYNLDCLSETAKLDSPYSKPIIKTYTSPIMASEIVQSMVDIQGISVDYQLIDWEINPMFFSIQGETPLEVIRRIAKAVGGIVQTKPDGTLLLLSEYPISPMNWEESSPVVVFSLATDVIKLSESLLINSGYNAFIITNYGGNEQKSITLQEENVNETTKIIKGFRVPFSDGPFDLFTSGGYLVQIDKQEYPEEKIIPEAENNGSEWEIVEFIGGTGKTQFPIYEIIEYQWLIDDLGLVAFLEDGTLTVNSLNGTESLLQIKYKTKYWKWVVKGIPGQYTQFFVPV